MCTYFNLRCIVSKYDEEGPYEEVFMCTYFNLRCIVCKYDEVRGWEVNYEKLIVN